MCVCVLFSHYRLSKTFILSFYSLYGGELEHRKLRSLYRPAVKINRNPKVVGGLCLKTVSEPMVSNRLLASSLLSYLVVALLFDATGWKSLFLNFLVMCLVFNPNSRIKLKMGFSYEKRMYTNGERDNDDNDDDDHANLHHREAGTPEQAD